MNQKLLVRLVAGLFGGVALVGVAQAGQIQSSSTSVAREVITTDTQTITAPGAAYRFSGDVDARSQAQTFQVQFTLGAGEFAALPGGIAQAFSITDGVTNQIQFQTAAADVATSVGALDPVGTPNTAQAVYTVDATGLSADRKTVYATFTIAKSNDALIRQPIIGFNAGVNIIDAGSHDPKDSTEGFPVAVVPGNRASIRDLYSVVGDIVDDFNTSPSTARVCEAVKTLPIDVKHFVALTQPTQLATTSNAQPDEHVRPGAANAATLIVFPTNLMVRIGPSTGDARLDGTTGNTAFAGTTGSWISATLANLGSVTLAQNSLGYDANLTNQYLLTGNPAGDGLTGIATATLNDGNVEVREVEVVVSATEGFVDGGTLFLDINPNCAGTTVSDAGVPIAITSANAAGPITLTIGTAQIAGSPGVAFGASGTGPVHVCYRAPGGVVIPSSSFSAVGTVVKANAGANLNEQNNVCNGNLYALAGGIKIDVRNYANSKDPDGWYSVIRLINTSETGTARVFAQIIEPDGKFGPWGQITTLAPRAVVNMTSSQIDALLTTSPSAGPATGSSEPLSYDASGAPRLRITAEGTDSLRVQNYMVNPTTHEIAEFSSAQGVDFDASPERAPASEGQYHSQDARTGINGRN